MKNKYPNIKSILAAVMMSVLLAVSCSDAAKYPELDKAESLMENHPDSAFSILKKVDKKKISEKKAAARYALLMSMALDKNFIDTTSFDVLQPAIDYYPENGTPDEKLRTFYYQGRIFDNRGEAGKALASFAKGIDNIEESHDSLCIARLFVSLGISYKKHFDFQNYTDYYLKAAEIYKSKHLEDKELDCLIHAINGSFLLNNKNKADSLMKRISHLDTIDNMQNDILSELQLSFIINFGSDIELKEYMSKYGDNSIYKTEDLLDLTSAHIRLGEFDQAIQTLSHLDKLNTGYDTLRYLLIRTEALEGLKAYRSALSTFKNACNKLDLISTINFKEQVQSIEEKHRIELKAETEARKKERFIWTFISGIALLTTGIIILALALRNTKIKKDLAILKVIAAEKEKEQLARKARDVEENNKRLQDDNDHFTIENEELKQERDIKTAEAEVLFRQVADLKADRDQLQILLKEQDDLPEEVRDAIRIRVEMQNSLLASYITNDDKFEKPYDVWIKALTEDRNQFMDSTRLAFKASHPNFIKHFEEQGLTNDEINYVCLYAIGLSGKEVGIYMNRPGHVNTSSAIRKKLGLDQHETNLGKYVRDLLKK